MVELSSNCRDPLTFGLQMLIVGPLRLLKRRGLMMTATDQYNLMCLAIRICNVHSLI